MAVNPEVAGKAAAFSREVKRLLPTLMRQYGLEELTTRGKLLRTIHNMFREHASVRDPGAVDTLIFKGRVELEEIVKNFKQRHHVLSTYIVPQDYAARSALETARLPGKPSSPFLDKFLKG